MTQNRWHKSGEYDHIEDYYIGEETADMATQTCEEEEAEEEETTLSALMWRIERLESIEGYASFSDEEGTEDEAEDEGLTDDQVQKIAYLNSLTEEEISIMLLQDEQYLREMELESVKGTQNEMFDHEGVMDTVSPLDRHSPSNPKRQSSSWLESLD